MDDVPVGERVRLLAPREAHEVAVDVGAAGAAIVAHPPPMITLEEDEVLAAQRHAEEAEARPSRVEAGCATGDQAPDAHLAARGQIQADRASIFAPSA